MFFNNERISIKFRTLFQKSSYNKTFRESAKVPLLVHSQSSSLVFNQQPQVVANVSIAHYLTSNHHTKTFVSVISWHNFKIHVLQIRWCSLKKQIEIWWMFALTWRCEFVNFSLSGWLNIPFFKLIASTITPDKWNQFKVSCITNLTRMNLKNKRALVISTNLYVLLTL